MRTLFLSAAMACCGLASAQCDMVVGNAGCVEYPHELRIPGRGKMPLALGRTASYYYLRTSYQADSAHLVMGTSRIVLTTPVPEGLAMAQDQMAALAEHPLDSLVIHSSYSHTAVAPKDASAQNALRTVAACALGAPVPAVGVPLPVTSGSSQRTARQSGLGSPGELLRKGGNRIAAGVGCLVAGGLGAVLVANLSPEANASVPLIIGGVGSVAWLVLTIDGSTKVAHGGALLRSRGF